MSGLRFVLIFHDRNIGDMTLSETPRFTTPRVSIYDLPSAMDYRGPINSTKSLISRSDRGQLYNQYDKRTSLKSVFNVFRRKLLFRVPRNYTKFNVMVQSRLLFSMLPLPLKNFAFII